VPELSSLKLLPISSSVARPKPYFSVLTGVRALAAYLVYFFHFNPFSAPSGPLTAVLWALFTKFNRLGVATFFVLSGFLIAVRYSEDMAWSWRWVARYLWKRFARIYPLYGLLTCLTFLLFWQRPAYDVSRVWFTYSDLDKVVALWLNLTCLRGFFDRFLYSGLLQGWSLTVEACFYLSAPWLLFSSRRRPVALLLWPAGLLGIGALLVVSFSQHPLYGGFFASYGFMLESTFFGRSSEFLTGIALAYFLQRQAPPAGSSFWRRAGGPLGLLLLLTAKVFLPFDNDPAAATRLPALVVNHLLLPLSLAGTFYGLLIERSWSSRVLGSRLFQLLGRSSYSFYLLHLGVLQLALRNHVTSNILLLFLLLNLLAILLFRWVEHPVQQWLTPAARPAGQKEAAREPASSS
jgi:peptidoglycan/LPS O-acetylase OafA/YrhL